MTEFNSISASRRLRLFHATAGLLLGLLALAWVVLLGVWGALHFVIVPRIADFRPELEQQASRLLGVPVRIGAIVTRSNGLVPSLELADVSLHDAQGRAALKLPVVVAALSARSIVGLGLEQLIIERPELDVRRDAAGQIWVAGLPMAQGGQGESAGADWVLSQPELVVRHGTVTWTDESRQAQALALTDVDVVLRSALRTHSLRVDATPPADWGSRWTLMGAFKQPLLTRRPSQWQDWSGQLFAQAQQIDMSRLRTVADLGVDVSQGQGALRAWLDVSRGHWSGGTADVSMRDVTVRLAPELEAIALRSVSGRVAAKALDGGQEVSTQALQFETRDGLRWPGGNVRLAWYGGDGRRPPRGELVADKLDLAAMAQIAQRLPLESSVHAQLLAVSPKGLVERLQANWQGPWERLTAYSVRGRVSQLVSPAAVVNGVQWPGVSGLDVDFDVTQNGGKASIALQGQLEVPGIFEDPVIPMQRLQGDVQWTHKGDSVALQIPNLQFANDDAQGEVRIAWRTQDTPGKPRLPGVLDLQGSMSRAAGNRVHRYLPQAINKAARDYVRDAITDGTASGVKYKVRGDLNDFPFTGGKSGEFRISANVRDVQYAYVPPSLQPKDALPFPALTALTGEFLLDHDVIRVRGAHAGVALAPGLRATKIDGVVESLYGGARVGVTAELQGPLNEALGVVNASPLGHLMGDALAKSTGSGVADYRFKLALPIAAVDKATVRGTVTLGGNDVQITPETPRLQRARGVVGFSETGVTVNGVQARALGGDVRIDGGLSVSPGKAAPSGLRIQGTASAEGLRQASELGLPSRLAQYANGTTTYTANLGLRPGGVDVQVNSALTGLALNLPTPFAKTAEASLPLRLELTGRVGPDGQVQRQQDQLVLDVGKVLQLTYVRDLSGSEPRVLRGAIGVGLAGDEVAPLPSEGVVANLNLTGVDADAWADVLNRASGTDLTPGALNVNDSATSLAYLPTSLAVRAREITLGGRKFNRVVVGGGREGLVWRANVDAHEMSGYVEYRQPSGSAAGRLYARLARLAIAQGEAQDVESALDEQPASIPALDIVVEDMELRGKKLGRVEIDAVNLGAAASSVVRDAPREWRLNRFNIITPEAQLTASGNWTAVAGATPLTSKNIKERRRTQMAFKLDIADGGELLGRFGMKDVVRRGKGKVEGQVSWLGSPITMDYPSLGGNLAINVENGQFLKTDPGIGKLVGVLSLQSLPRRLTLDFRDVFSEGFAFDFFRGDVAIAQGIARTNNLQMKGVNGAAMMEGQADIAKETQNLKVVVVPDIDAGSAALLASYYINPLFGLSTYLANLILRRPLIEANTHEFLIDGTWVDPRVTPVERKPKTVAPPPTPRASEPQ
ncbi:MAG: YhdP family protein [Rhodoferax sp.]